MPGSVFCTPGDCGRVIFPTKVNSQIASESRVVNPHAQGYFRTVPGTCSCCTWTARVKGSGGDVTERDETASPGRRRKLPPPLVPRPDTLLSSTLPPSPPSLHLSHLEPPCTPANTTTSSNFSSSAIQASERCALFPPNDHCLLSLLSTTLADLLRTVLLTPSVR